MNKKNWFQTWLARKTSWTAEASAARRRFGNTLPLRLMPAKALSPLRSASIVQNFRRECAVFPLVLSVFFLTLNFSASAKPFNVLNFGAKGDGATLDTAAVQRAIDAAATEGGTVLIPRKKTFLVSTLNLKGGIDFHLDGTLLISTNQTDYASDGVITASNAPNLKITGSGKILGQSLSFMSGYDTTNEWWLFKEWRPKMFVLTGCTNLTVRDLTFGDAPFWGLHMLGCVRVLVDNVTVDNRLDVPNDDGIDPDHCRDVEIKNCHVTCGDDAIVLKSTRQTNDFGDCANIHVHDCVIRTQDAGLKIGTETTGNIHDVLFEHCKILQSSRGLCIQLRDEGDVSNIVFRDIKFVSRFHGDPWWGRGEAISFTAIPRTPTTKLGRLHDLTVENVSGRAENSIRVNGTAQSRIENVRFKNVAVNFARWTKYPGGVYDNRPTKVLTPIEPHAADGFNLRHADNVSLENCALGWNENGSTHFTDAVHAEEVRDLMISGFSGDSTAHPIQVR
jgi:polygalacturonase